MPESGIGRVLALFFSYFWKLVGANLLFVLFSIPVVTIPAALCAMNRVCILIYRKGHCFLWMDFWQEFKRSLWRSFLPGVLFAGIVFLGYFFMSLAAANGAFPVWCLLFWFVGIAATIVGICWGAYFYVLVPLLDISISGALKNAFLLCFLRPKSAFLVLATVLGMWFAAVTLMPVFIFALLLFWFAWMQYMVCYLVNTVAEVYILRPFKEQQNNIV